MNEEIKEERIDDGFEKQETANIWLPKAVNEQLMGSVKNIQEGMYGVQLLLMTEKGEDVLTPSHKVLQNRVSKVKNGDIVKIIYLGEEPGKPGKNPTKLYDVYIKKV